MITDQDLNNYAARLVAKLHPLSDLDYQDRAIRQRGSDRKPKPEREKQSRVTQGVWAPSWQARGLCVGTNGNWIDVEVGGKRARLVHRTELALCDACLVKQECLDFAVAHAEDVGIWGGTLPAERRKIRKAQKGAAPRG